jgi:ubiquinone/menaquinone biosynthesis C-methylase UbiE
VGIDISPEMLGRAERDVPEATFHPADLRALPFADQEYDLVVCGLALAHLAELSGTVGELARVLRPGGRLVVSVLHPFLAHLGWHAPFADAEGRRRFVCEDPHAHAEYFAGFRAA